MTDTLSEGLSFLSASGDGAYDAGQVVWVLGTLPSGETTNVSVTVAPITAGLITNTVTVASVTPDPDLSNNTATLIGDTNATVSIITQPANLVVAAGGTANFQVGAESLAALSHLHAEFQLWPRAGRRRHRRAAQ